MKNSLLVIFALLCITAHVNAELKFVVQLYRHGARGPLGNWYDANQQLAQQGELSPTGQRQHYNLGVKLRQEYQGFIPHHYNHSEIYVRSSDVNRTLMSAASQLQGMFPEHTGAVLPANLSEQYTLPAYKDAQNYLNETQSALPTNIQVLPIHTQLSTGDIVLQPDQNCKNYNKIKSEFYSQKKDIINFVNQQFNNTYQQYSLAINQTVKNFDDMHSLESTLECDRFNGRYVPDFSPELRENATWLTTLSWNFMYDQPQLLRAMNTPFLNQLLAYINPVVQGNNTSGLKWVMLSAHDTNVHLVSAALNITSIECLLHQRFPEKFPAQQNVYNCESYPRFTASLIFEVHQADNTVIDNGVKINQGEYYIRIKRDGKFMNLCEKNSTICSFFEFNYRVNQYTIDFNAVCNTQSQKPIQTQTLLLEEQALNESNSSTYYILALILQQIVIVVGGYIFYKKRQNNKINAFQNFSDIESITTQN